MTYRIIGHALAALLWGEDGNGPHRHGKGVVHPAGDLRGILLGMGLTPDFAVVTPGSHAIDWIHRRSDAADIYFVTNGSDQLPVITYS